MQKLLLDFLRVASPTFHEAAATAFLVDWLKEHMPKMSLQVFGNEFVAKFESGTKPHLTFVGHSDVVPVHFEPYEKDGKVFGAGASDMKGGIAAFLDFISRNFESLTAKYNLSIIIYSREEGTGIKENGLYELIQIHPEVFKGIDLAIVAEPTNNAIQLGCVGSCHVQATVFGKASHSARPWDGENALYKALPFIEAISKIAPKKHRLFGVDFFDVIQITESQSEPGRTTLPGKWDCNVNFRFAPIRSPEEAEQEILALLNQHLPEGSITKIIDTSPAGSVIETPIFTQTIKRLNAPVEAKQAWTDVAQLTQLGIPALNFGPGLTSQAHRPDEYIQIADIDKYQKALEKLLQ